MRTDRPSATACLIAASLACDFHDSTRRMHVSPLAGELGPVFMKAYGTPANFFASVCTHRWFRFLARNLEQWTIPGITLHYLLRKRFIEDKICELLQEKTIGQVVILGAGFDTFALRTHPHYSAIRFIEVDHPSTQRVKKKALEDHNPIKENLLFLPATLGQETLEEVLSKCPEYQPGANSLFLCEGVLMYLTEGDVRRIFQCIREFTGEKSLFVFSFMEKREDGSTNFKVRSRAVDFWGSSPKFVGNFGLW